MGMTNGNGKRIGGIGRGGPRLRQKHFQHVMDLRLFRMPYSHHRFFDPVRSVFRNGNSRRRRNQKGYPSGLPQLERGASIFADKGLLDRRFVRLVVLEHLGERHVDSVKTLGHSQRGTCRNHAVSHMAKAASPTIDDAPAGISQSWIKTDDSHDEWV